MIGLDNYLMKLYSDQLISAEEALSKAQLPDAMKEKLIAAGAKL